MSEDLIHKTLLQSFLCHLLSESRGGSARSSAQNSIFPSESLSRSCPPVQAAPPPNSQFFLSSFLRIQISSRLPLYFPVPRARRQPNDRPTGSSGWEFRVCGRVSYAEFPTFSQAWRSPHNPGYRYYFSIPVGIDPSLAPES